MPVHVVDKLIESMDKRITLIINCQGKRTIINDKRLKLVEIQCRGKTISPI